jgi:hypothetical protein
MGCWGRTIVFAAVSFSFTRIASADITTGDNCPPGYSAVAVTDDQCEVPAYALPGLAGMDLVDGHDICALGYMCFRIYNQYDNPFAGQTPPADGGNPWTNPDWYTSWGYYSCAISAYTVHDACYAGVYGCVDRNSCDLLLDQTWNQCCEGFPFPFNLSCEASGLISTFGVITLGGIGNNYAACGSSSLGNTNLNGCTPKASYEVCHWNTPQCQEYADNGCGQQIYCGDCAYSVTCLSYPPQCGPYTASTQNADGTACIDVAADAGPCAAGMCVSGTCVVDPPPPPPPPSDPPPAPSCDGTCVDGIPVNVGQPCESGGFYGPDGNCYGCEDWCTYCMGEGYYDDMCWTDIFEACGCGGPG